MGMKWSVFKDYFFHVCRACLFGYNHPFNAHWDHQLERILKAGELLSVSDCVATFAFKGNVFEVWIGNRWYAYASLARLNGDLVEYRLQVRPKFRNMRHLRFMVDAFTSKPRSRKEFYARLDLLGKAHD
ncbi:hypothetical protein [Enterobacter sp. UNJFSC 003]|uniref:hypothetical protein n=1 Tax=Enterobacter sp. UNJFSC 003 TaxID=3122077 RepID=UPI002EB9C7BA|nr:hypothetical protein [Serratia liquefaciens]